MTPTEIEALGDERRVLEVLYRARYPHLRSTEHTIEECEQADLRAFRFWKLLDAGAYLDAAMMLVPEGFGFSLHTPSTPDPENLPSARVWAPTVGTFQGYAVTPALALCGAIARATPPTGAE